MWLFFAALPCLCQCLMLRSCMRFYIVSLAAAAFGLLPYAVMWLGIALPTLPCLCPKISSIVSLARQWQGGIMLHCCEGGDDSTEHCAKAVITAALLWSRT